MAKYKFYNVVFKSGKVIKEKVIIDTSPQSIKKKYVDVEILNIKLIALSDNYRETYKLEILNFLQKHNIFKFEVIFFDEAVDHIERNYILTTSKRAIGTLCNPGTVYKIIRNVSPTYEEMCFFFFENDKKTVITDF